ncbi:uncharacterized protein BP5553_08436 [Venustampulla echinocandica]|uniref:Major facilitator superfamily (MFS) profile domain-containing protein n=1 Tax=Venustampulla echinocandica TaxID=2656787 RepID=A0A370TE76_9HELO|nr:uncharacterized protein BP5553_08436 [Venustampulla echinocandica]RDL32997.1 hypothetical protein BP5553_08436 [Venustampulla echinocandica]
MNLSKPFLDEDAITIVPQSRSTNGDEPQDESCRATMEELGLRLEEDGYVKWRSDAPAHPRNWGAKRKMFDTMLILILDLFTTAVSTAGPTIAERAKVEYGLSRTTSLVVFASMYQFGQAVGGVFFPPYSEAFGRKSVYIVSTVFYCVSCIMVGTPKFIATAVIGRFISGIMSAVPSVIVSGSLEDMFDIKERVWLMFAWSCATTGGLLLGPVFGSYVAKTLGWRWVFHIAAITTFVLAILLLFIKESRPSKLLAKRLSMLHRKTGKLRFRIENPDHVPDFKTFTKTSLRRPIRLFFTEPIVFVVSVMSSAGWALIYLFTEAIPVIYTGFGLTREQSSLMFLAIGVGICFGVLPRIHDHTLLRDHDAANKSLHPEDKLLGFAFAAPSLAAGLWWLVLTVPPASTLPWYATIPGLMAVGFATNEYACTLSGYLADTYTIYAASAFAALSFLRAVLAGLFPLVGEPMYAALGVNWATVVLAAVATIFCIVPPLFSKYGRQIRQRSKFARYSLEINRKMQIKDENIE